MKNNEGLPRGRCEGALESRRRTPVPLGEPPPKGYRPQAADQERDPKRPKAPPGPKSRRAGPGPAGGIVHVPCGWRGGGPAGGRAWMVAAKVDGAGVLRLSGAAAGAFGGRGWIAF